jgi:hypothetical protein
MIKNLISSIKRILTVPQGLDINSIHPVSTCFGLDRGTPIDRYYINCFLSYNHDFISGNVLEIAESTYSKKFGKNVSKREVLHVDETNPNATIIGDLTNLQTLPEGTIDCFICTQTYNFIYNFKHAILGSYKLLKPNGILLATVAGISQISEYDKDRWGDFWRFTPQSSQLVFEEVFGKGNVTIDYYGNCLAATSFIRGIAAEEIKRESLDVKDPNYPITITIIAKKNEANNY